MISEIAYELVKYLSEEIAYIDKWCGIVVPLHQSVAGKDKVMPAYINTKNVCNVSDYMDLVPDSTKKSICYVERISEPTFEPISRGLYVANANIRIVLWYNLQRITQGAYADSEIFASNIISTLPKKLSNSLFANTKGVTIGVTGTTSGSQLFDKYSYEEVKAQYMTFPYGAIGVNLDVTYVVTSCIDIVVPLPSECVGQNLEPIIPMEYDETLYRRTFEQPDEPGAAKDGDLWIKTT